MLPNVMFDACSWDSNTEDGCDSRGDIDGCHGDIVGSNAAEDVLCCRDDRSECDSWTGREDNCERVDEVAPANVQGGKR